jgi:hypothetical protein
MEHDYTPGNMQSFETLKPVVSIVATLLYRLDEISKLKIRRDEMHVI